MFKVFSFVVSANSWCNFVREINPYDFDNAVVLSCINQGTGVYEIRVSAMEKDREALEKLAARFS